MVAITVDQYPVIMREAISALGSVIDIEIVETKIEESEVEDRDPMDHVAFTWTCRFKFREMFTEKIAQGKIIWNTGLIDAGIVRSYTARSACTAIGVAMRGDVERDYIQRAAALWRRWPNWGLGIAVMVQEIIQATIGILQKEGRVMEMNEAIGYTLKKFYDVTQGIFEHEIWPQFMNELKEAAVAARSIEPEDSGAPETEA